MSHISNTEVLVMAMMRMLLEVLLVFGLIVGLFYMSKTMAKENRLNNSDEEKEGS
ncbi:MAG: hypothetical protein ABL925_17180 [Methylococcales bacterium]